MRLHKYDFYILCKTHVWQKLQLHCLPFHVRIITLKPSILTSASLKTRPKRFHSFALWYVKELHPYVIVLKDGCSNGFTHYSIVKLICLIKNIFYINRSNIMINFVDFNHDNQWINSFHIHKSLHIQTIPHTNMAFFFVGGVAIGHLCAMTIVRKCMLPVTQVPAPQHKEAFRTLKLSINEVHI